LNTETTVSLISYLGVAATKYLLSEVYVAFDFSIAKPKSPNELNNSRTYFS
jgi:hypothetical protein